VSAAKLLVRSALGVLGWRCEGKPPGVARCVMVAYPHTSNWDLFCLFAYAILEDVPVGFAIKRSWMRGPLGVVLRALGGVSVDRTGQHSQVEQLAQALLARESLALCFTPEGTRARSEGWKTGFYYTALEAKVPLFLSFIDGRRKVFGTGPLIWPSGDLDLDFQQFRGLFDGLEGIVPERAGLIRVFPKK